MNVLIIGKNWPESVSSAAGTRTLDLIRCFQQAQWSVHLASDALATEHSDPLPQVTKHRIQLNHESFDAWIQKLDPQVVIFDRFMTEEQFGWRVAQQCPDALRVLDTSDLHCLRDTRQRWFKKHRSPIPDDQLVAQLKASPIAQREIPALCRCDLNLMISPVEMAILDDVFNLDAQWRHWLPFLVPSPSTPPVPFQDRHHMMFIGGFLHEPNVDAVQWLAQEIWPLVQSRLPGVECHIYGAYAPEKILQLQKPKQHFFVKGRAQDAQACMAQYRINLAPLRFGAGNKGKILDGWVTGTPTVTTPIGIEGMLPPGTKIQVSDNAKELADYIVQLYQSEQLWLHAQEQGAKCLAPLTFDQHQPQLIKRIEEISSNLVEHRQGNFWGQVLSQQQYRATEFMARWIEAKNKL